MFCFVFESTCFNGVDELTCFGVLSSCSLLTGSTAAFLGACRYWELETRAKGGIPYVDSRPNASLLTCCLDFIPGTLRGRRRVKSGIEFSVVDDMYTALSRHLERSPSPDR